MRDVFAMNEARAAHAGSEIVLARESPFRLAGTLVRPAALELEFQSETIRVEPRVMQVLVALSRTGGEPASRERLIECCWGGRLVTDGALNRSIAQLRKALRDPGLEIRTIPRVGYTLRSISAAEPLESRPIAGPRNSTAFPGSTKGPQPITGSASSRRVAQVAAVVAVVLITLGVVAWELIA